MNNQIGEALRLGAGYRAYIEQKNNPRPMNNQEYKAYVEAKTIYSNEAAAYLIEASKVLGEYVESSTINGEQYLKTIELITIGLIRHFIPQVSPNEYVNGYVRDLINPKHDGDY